MAIRAYSQLVMITFLISVFLSLGGCANQIEEEQPAILSGIVVNTTEQPVKGALIRVIGSEHGTISGQNGEFTLQLAEGQWDVVATCDSSVSQTTRVCIEGGKNSSLNLQLASSLGENDSPLILSPIELKSSYKPEESVDIEVLISNSSNDSMLVSQLYFEVRDERGQLIYTSDIAGSDFAVAPQREVRISRKWNWSGEGGQMPYILGNTVILTVYAVAKPVSADLSVSETITASTLSRFTFESSALSVYAIPLSKSYTGSSKNTVRPGGCILSTKQELENFLKAMGETKRFSFDFSKVSLLAVAGSHCASLPAAISIKKLEKVTVPMGNKQTQTKFICRVEANTAGSGTPTNWELLPVAKSDLGTSSVEFIWQNN